MQVVVEEVEDAPQSSFFKSAKLVSCFLGSNSQDEIHRVIASSNVSPTLIINPLSALKIWKVKTGLTRPQPQFVSPLVNTKISC